MKYNRKNLLKSNEASGDEMSSPLFLRIAHFSISAVLLIMIQHGNDDDDNDDNDDADNDDDDGDDYDDVDNEFMIGHNEDAMYHK